MPNDGLRERLAVEATVISNASWTGIAATMQDASSVLSQHNNLLMEALPHLSVRDPELAKRVADAITNPDPKLQTPYSAKHDSAVGQRFKAHDGCTYLCDSYDPRIGYWMTPENARARNSEGKVPERRNVSERTIGRTFHVIMSDEHGEFCALEEAPASPKP